MLGFYTSRVSVCRNARQEPQAPFVGENLNPTAGAAAAWNKRWS